MSARTQLDLRSTTSGPASPEHKRFQTLMGKIAKARARLEAWQREAPLFAQRHAAQAAPLIEQLTQARRAWAFDLEALIGARRWSKADRECLSQMLVELCDTLLAIADGPDDELKALYNRHSETDFDDEERQHLDSMKALMEEASGIELGDEPAESIDELMDRAREQMAQQPPETARRPKRKTANQRRAEEDQQRISQTVREVYRKLASALHPDRVDADLPRAERDARTALMQRANVAYEAGDLLALLELQLQIEQVDLAKANRMAAEQVRHFNKVLAEQLRELEMELDGRQMAFCEAFGLITEQRIDPAKLDDLLRDQLRQIGAVQARITYDRRLLERGDITQVRQFFKHWRREQRAAAFDGLFF